MHRFGLTVLLVAASLACEPSKSTTPPEPSPAESKPEPEPEPEVEPEPEPEPAPEPEPEEPEVSEFAEAVLSQGGFEARGLKCTFAEPTREGQGYIIAGLVDADAALDACAPKGAAIDVSWNYVSGQAGNIDVSAKTSKQANCVATAMGQVRAGIEAECSAVLLLGDPAAAAAAYEAR
jgi:hypothetical protein